MVMFVPIHVQLNQDYKQLESIKRAVHKVSTRIDGTHQRPQSYQSNSQVKQQAVVLKMVIDDARSIQQPSDVKHNVNYPLIDCVQLKYVIPQDKVNEKGSDKRK